MPTVTATSDGSTMPTVTATSDGSTMPTATATSGGEPVTTNTNPDPGTTTIDSSTTVTFTMSSADVTTTTMVSSTVQTNPADTAPPVPARPAAVVAGLSFALGPGVGDSGSLALGVESEFTLVTETILREPAACISLNRIQLFIRGSQNNLVGYRYSSPCQDGHYSLAWTPCLTGWHTISIEINGVRIASSPQTVWVAGSAPKKFKFVGGGSRTEFDFKGMMEGVNL